MSEVPESKMATIILTGQLLIGANSKNVFPASLAHLMPLCLCSYDRPDTYIKSLFIKTDRRHNRIPNNSGSSRCQRRAIVWVS